MAERYTLADLRGLAGALVGRAVERVGEFLAPDAAAPRAHAPVLPPPLTAATVDGVRSALESLERGIFFEAARLALHFGRDADVRGALQQRVLGLQALPFQLAPADERKVARDVAAEVAGLWPRMCPAAAVADLVRSVVWMGFAVGQQVWAYDEGLQHFVPRVDPWPAYRTSYRPWDGTWWAHTLEGLVQITPGNGWVLYAPDSVHEPYMYGAVRCLGDHVLGTSFASRDWRRRNEVLGQGAWLAKVPTGTKVSDDAKRFLASIRSLGRSGVIQLPQGRTPEESYGLDLLEGEPGAWEDFSELVKMGASKVRLAILGQDLTSVDNKGGGFARAKVGNDVRGDVRASDARTLGEALAAQLVDPYVRYRTGRADLTPRPTWDAREPEDLAATSKAQLTGAQAVASWKALGVQVDEHAEAQRHGLRVKKAQDA